MKAADIDDLHVDPAEIGPSPPEPNGAAPRDAGGHDAGWETEPIATSWRPKALADVLAGNLQRRQPELLCRTDGPALFYRGLSSMLFGASESAKSWIGLLVVVETVRAGETAVIVDLESDIVEIMSRLRTLGLSDTQILDHVAYIQPDEPLNRILAGPGATLTATDRDLAGALDRRPAVVIVDALGELFALHGLDPLSNRDAPLVTGFLRRLADRTGAAVISLDHTPHAPREGGARAPIGAQHKRAAVTGVAYEVRATTPLAPGKVGKVSLRINKDRPGGVREHALGNTAARITLDAATHPSQILTSIEPAMEGPSEALAACMARVVEALRELGSDGLSKNQLRQVVTGKNELIDDALHRLRIDGRVEVRKGARGALLHVLSSSPQGPEVDPLAPF